MHGSPIWSVPAEILELVNTVRRSELISLELC
jgi:hypothetical protein